MTSWSCHFGSAATGSSFQNLRLSMFISSNATLNVVKSCSFLHESCLLRCKEFSKIEINQFGYVYSKLRPSKISSSGRLNSAWTFDFDLWFLPFLFVFWLQVLHENCFSWCFILETPTFSCHLFFGCNLKVSRMENLWFSNT